MSSTVCARYRGLIRAANTAFQNDAPAFSAALERIREEFRKPLEEPSELRQRLQFAKDVAHILRTNVVQGVNSGSDSSPVYNLQIHKESELGDNDSRFGSPLSGADGAAEGCCGASSAAANKKI